MTGEITLRGRVLPIGGLKEKMIAALRGGIDTVLIPKENEKDLADIPQAIRRGLRIVTVEHMDEVLGAALSLAEPAAFLREGVHEFDDIHEVRAAGREARGAPGSGRRKLSASGRVAQLVERLAYTEEVGGSSPSAPTKICLQLSGMSRSSTVRRPSRCALRIAWSHDAPHDLGERPEHAIGGVVAAGLHADVVLEPARDDQHVVGARRRGRGCCAGPHDPALLRGRRPPRARARCAPRPRPRGAARRAGARPSSSPCRTRGRCASGCRSTRCRPSTRPRTRSGSCTSCSAARPRDRSWAGRTVRNRMLEVEAPEGARAGKIQLRLRPRIPMSADLDALDIIGNDTYAANGYPHDAWTRLRREDPIHWNTRNIINPFWAVTKHADIVWISKQPDRFLNGPRLAAFPEMTPPEGAVRGPPPAQHGPARPRAVPQAREPPLHAARARAHAPRHRADHARSARRDDGRRRRTAGRLRRAAVGPPAAPGARGAARRAARDVAHDVRLDQPRDRLRGPGVPASGRRRVPDRAEGAARAVRVFRRDGARAPREAHATTS